MVFSAGFCGAELVAVVVVADAPGVEVVGSVVDEQAAIKTTTLAKSPTMCRGCTLRERKPSSRKLCTFCARGTIIVTTTASVMGLRVPCVDHGFTLSRYRTRNPSRCVPQDRRLRRFRSDRATDRILRFGYLVVVGVAEGTNDTPA